MSEFCFFLKSYKEESLKNTNIEMTSLKKKEKNPDLVE